MTNNDLQIGVGTADNTGSNVNFAAANMKHVNGLAVVNLNGKTVPQTYFYDGNTGNASSVRAASTTTATVWPSVNFSSSTRPFSISNTSSLKRYLAIIKPSTATTISTTATSGCEAWSLSYNVNQNTSSSQSVTSSRPGYYLGWVYSYTGAVHTFTASTAGIYKLEVGGASAGALLWNGVVNKDKVLGGGYSNGKISLSSSNKLYISVGGKGEDGKYQKDNAGGWNGGGKGIWDHNDDESLGGGGGCTSIQISLISDGQLYQYKDNKDKVLIVAGGSGGFGSDPLNTKNICYGGGTEAGGGYIVNDSYKRIETLSPANQSSGYAFGKGQDANYNGHWNPESPGGGGGWYGGFAPIDQIDASYGSAGGGSGYVNTSKLTEASTIAGNTAFPSPSGGTETGHTGNGYAIITQVSY